MTPAARLAAAISLLATVEANPRRPADAAAHEFFRARRFIGAGDRRAVSERAWSVLRAYRRLHWWLARAETTATPRTLVIAALLLEGWDPNGILQSFSGGRYAPGTLDAAETALLHKLAGHTLEHPDMPLAVRLEVPDWILPALAERFGPDLVPEMQAMSHPATLDLRVNLLRTTREAARGELRAEGFEAAPTKLSPWGLRIFGRRPITAGAAFQSGLVEIQDEGSQLVAALVGAAPGMRVLDYCAGAGGKTLAMAMMMENRGHIAAADNSAPRLEGAVRRLRRAGVHNVERHLLEPGDKWAKRRAASFDRVLIDAPCTGTGTWRRNPDARSRLSPEDLAELRAKQSSLLDDAAPMVRKGGRLIYATCSLLTAENEQQIEDFLARNSNFTPLPLSEAWPLPGDLPCPGPTLSLTPLRHETDGFFAAVLQRTH